ncbi:GntR family transcriptional regulator [Amycolatopsis alkalitolerans]|uniref:GntR family transcriptional regulator n=1 Tax=Amycolatopsis alkalitolerans TaxID=2547244 RepID=UPI001F22B982|nr:GntR family transcriptional regulator [Amycolatopsis alkalitolerans]
MRPLDRKSERPLWKQLQERLRERVAAGEFTGHFPGELALVEQYGVSRHTVRQALRELRAEGMVTAERGRQPRVAPNTEIQQPLGALYSLFASVETAGLQQDSLVLVLDTRTDAPAAGRLGLDASAPLVYLERVRLAGAQPLALDRAWLPADVAAPLLEADFTHTSLYAELAARAGIRLERGEEKIHAVMPTPAERALLGCDPGAAAFSIDRAGYARGEPVEWRHTLVRGDRFALTAEFSAGTGYRLR